MMNYQMHYTYNEIPKADNYRLHTHDEYELLLFFGGDAQYVIEGIVYPLKPNDLVITRPNEMHRVVHLSKEKYNRFVLTISKEFFIQYECQCYEAFFERTDFGAFNKINADVVMKSGIYDCFLKIQKYTENFKNKYVPVVNGIILEILHILNSNDDLYEIAVQPTLIRNVISYINNHFQNKINLETLAESNFISKYYLCRIFKAKTGYTITGFINHKRILNIRQLCKSGMSITNACLESGFSSYSAFYKAYSKENDLLPKEFLKNIKTV